MRNKKHWTNFEIRFFGWSITLREIIASVIIIAIMMLLGFNISEHIIETEAEQNEKYIKALKIDDAELFIHCMNTNIGDAFVYGDLIAVDSVTYEEIGGEYMSVKKVTEEYTRHTRVVTKTRTKPDGKVETYTETEVYYSWDTIDSDTKHCDKVTFLGVEFDYGHIATPHRQHIITIRDVYDSDIRYVYSGSSTKHTGTAFCKLYGGNIHEVDWYSNSTIQETYDYLYSSGGEYVFWILWILITCLIVFMFYYADNNWLD